MDKTEPVKKITMQQVAIKAQVSTATVSRTLAFPGKVSLATRLRVEQAAGELGYLPFSLRNLRQNVSRTILVIVPDICDPFYYEVIRGIEMTAARHGYLVIIGDCAHQEKQEKSFIDLIIGKEISGVLLMNGQLPIQASRDEKRYLPPMVIVNDFNPRLDLPAVYIDNLSAAFNAVNYLYQLGHKRVACIAGPKQATWSEHRLQGYIQALTRNGQQQNPKYIVRGSADYASGKGALAKLLALPEPPDAVFCHNDILALGALSYARQQGISVPEQLSLMGFDNIALTEFSDPPLTTMALPGFDMGREAILLLIAKITGKPIATSSLLLECQLIVRSSTCAA